GMGVPEIGRREEVRVEDGLVLVVDDGARYPPALPARLHRAITEVDVLDVELVTGVPPADLVEHRPAHEEEGAEHRVDLQRAVDGRIEQVMAALPAQRREERA